MSKLMCIPSTLVIETIMNTRHQDLTPAMNLSLIMILGGVGLFALTEPKASTHILGYLWAILAVIATSLSNIFFGPLQRSLEMNPLQLMFHSSPLLTLGSFVIIPLFEDRNDLMDTKLTGNLVQNIFCSCVAAVFLNISNYFVLSLTTPLTYLVLGHIKTIIILVLGFLFFDRTMPSSQVLVGVVIALLGVGLYSWENTRQQEAKKLKASTANHPPPRYQESKA